MSRAIFQEGLEHLLHIGAIDQLQSQVLRTEHRQTQKPLEELCVDLHFLSARTIGKLMAEWKGYPEAPLAQMVLDVRLIQNLSRDICFQHHAIPLCEREGEIWIVLADVHNLVTRDLFSRLFLGQKLKFFWAPQRDILNAIEQYYGFDMTLEGLLEEMENPLPPHLTPDSWVHPTVRFVQALFFDGVQAGASDIHCEPEKSFIRIRYRCDGLLKTAFIFHRDHWASVLNRFKIIANMNIAETRKPQNGRFTGHLLGRVIDFRIASHPTFWGENLVIRILDPKNTQRFLGTLGYSPEVSQKIEGALQKPEGLIIVTGPTGAGKTTALYALLNQLDAEKLKIMTLEEPIEYQLPFISQTDICESIGLTFASGVKSILRQDPDVILIGEIRDSETAYMALRAAMTGHQVLTTLHTPDALSTVYRLLELGINPAFLAGHLNCLIAQRLLRKLCIACKKPVSKPIAMSSSLPTTLFEPTGCPLCEGTGYKNRFALAEVVLFNEALNTWLLEGAHRTTVLSLLHKQGFKTFWEEGLTHVFQGTTSLNELERVLGAPSFS